MSEVQISLGPPVLGGPTWIFFYVKISFVYKTCIIGLDHFLTDFKGPSKAPLYF